MKVFLFMLMLLFIFNCTSIQKSRSFAEGPDKIIPFRHVKVEEVITTKKTVSQKVPLADIKRMMSISDDLQDMRNRIEKLERLVIQFLVLANYIR